MLNLTQYPHGSFRSHLVFFLRQLSQLSVILLRFLFCSSVIPVITKWSNFIHYINFGVFFRRYTELTHNTYCVSRTPLVYILPVWNTVVVNGLWGVRVHFHVLVLAVSWRRTEPRAWGNNVAVGFHHHAERAACVVLVEVKSTSLRVDIFAPENVGPASPVPEWSVSPVPRWSASPTSETSCRRLLPVFSTAA